MKAWMAQLDVQDVCLVLGLALLGTGTGMICIPAGLIVVGVVLLTLAIWRM